MSASRALKASEQATEAVRALNHATIDPGALGPVDLYRVLGDLVTLLQRLPQAVDQCRRSVTTWSGDLRSDDERDPNEVWGLLVGRLGLAAGLLGEPLAELDRAYQDASHLYVAGPVSA